MDDEVVVCESGRALSLCVKFGKTLITSSYSSELLVPAQHVETTVEVGAEDPTVECDGQEVVARKRTTVHLPQEVKVWFFDYLTLSRNASQTTGKTPLSQAQRLMVLRLVYGSRAPK
eukprot:796984-Amphidinium_carterae.1